MAIATTATRGRRRGAAARPPPAAPAARRRPGRGRPGRCRGAGGRAKKAACMAFTARFSSAAGTTSEMFSSEEPWAIARTFTPLSPSTPKTRPAMPGWRAMPAPTAAITDCSGSTTSGSTMPSCSSSANSAVDRRRGRWRRRRGHREADRMLGRALADQDHRNVFAGQAAEEALGDARHPDHAVAFEAGERHLGDRARCRGSAPPTGGRCPAPGCRDARARRCF